LLGSLEIELASGAPALRRKSRALLAYLAATGRPYRRRTLMDMFCQEAGDPAGALRWHLSWLRRQLDPEALLQTEDAICFNSEMAKLRTRSAT
jgi:DNA-binding SARP family transcriptional activator